MSKILRITAADLDADNFYTPSTSVDFQGSIEIAARLGIVRFRGTVKASAAIVALAGSGIEAGWGIEAGSGIEAGWGIEAGEGIEAGWGIEAGLGIICKLSIVCRLRIFSGLCQWRLPSYDEKLIKCLRLEGGATVEYGILIETEKHNVAATGNGARLIDV